MSIARSGCAQAIIIAVNDRILFTELTTKQEIAQNIICKLNELEFWNIYKRAVILKKTFYCMKYMRACDDAKLNEKMGIKPYGFISVNHIISVIIYCSFFHVCQKWLEYIRTNQQNNQLNDGEFAHFYRYLCEICQIFGQTISRNEYLYYSNK